MSLIPSPFGPAAATRLILAASWALVGCAFAEVSVKTEQINPANRAWKFKNIPGPSKSDIAEGAKITVEGNTLESSAGSAAVLVNGKLTNDPYEVSEAALLTNDNANDGTLTLDLGKEQPVAAVSSYSWHEYPADQGCRGPQVYTLSGSADGQSWTKLADVDTRPNTTGQNWNGQHGAFISDSKGDLGNFRYLRFDLKRTRSPLQSDAGVTATMFSEIDVHTKTTLAKAGDATAPAVSPVKEIIVVIKTHFDIGYTHRVNDVIPFYRTAMIDKALAGMDASLSLPPERQFSWTGPGWVMSKVLEDWPCQTPERRKRLDEAVKSGKFRFHALPFSLESDACEPEEMARGLIFASTISRKYGLPLPIAGKMSDVPSHGGALETVLAHGGVKFMHSGGNWPSGYVKTPGIFWWEGPDGSRTLTFQSGTYGTATGFNWPDNWRSDGYLGTHFVPPANWPYKIWPAIMVTMDNSGPPKPETVKAYFEEAQKKCPGVKIRMGTMDDFARAFLAENPDLPVVKGEMPDTWIHGVMCDPGGSKLSREAHPLIASAEVLNTQLGLWGVAQPPVAKEVADAYENILLYGEHTWGMAPDVRNYGDAFAKADPKLIATLEGSWEDKTNYIRNADKIARTIADTDLDTLAKSVKAAPGSVIVYNPLPWPRSGIVEA